MNAWQRYLPFAPSLVLGLTGAAWIAVRPIGFAGIFAAERGLFAVAAATAGFVLVALGSAWLLERLLPSFRYAGNLMERVLVRLQLPVPAVLLLAALTAASEEILFRGALLQEFGIWPQAILFGLLHPATRKGWSYPVFAFFAALGFAWLAQFTGTLWAPIAAHFTINLYGLLEARKGSTRRAGRPSAG